MRITLIIAQRNLRSYFRDPTSVFLSMLSALILLLLYVLFLGQLQIDAIAESYPGPSPDAIPVFVYSWVFSGIVTVTTLTTSLAVTGTYVDDRVSGRFKDFRVSPVRPLQVVSGYQISAFVVSVMMGAFVLLLGIGIIGAKEGVWLRAAAILEAVGVVVILSAAFGSVAALITSFVRSHGAFTAASTITGTVIGFLAGAYLPVGMLSQSTRDVMNALPFSPGAMLMREPLASAALDELTAGHADARSELREYFGFDLSVGSSPVQPWLVIMLLLTMTVVLTMISARRMSRSIR